MKASDAEVLEIQKCVLRVAGELIFEARYPYAMTPEEFREPVKQLRQIQRDLRKLKTKGK